MNSSNRGSNPSAEGTRLQKVLAAAGFGSRRRCEQLIDEGRVSVDGKIVTHQGVRVNPREVVIRVDDQRIAAPADTVVLAMNKPVGFLTAMSDDRGRPCVGDIVYESEFGVGSGVHQLAHVGRLDADTEGVLLFTNDGDLSHLLTHPSFGVSKTYVAGVTGVMRPGDIKRLKQGIKIDDRPVVVESAKILDTSHIGSLVELTIHEGRNRIVRRLLAELGFPVESLIRTRFGSVNLGRLRSGDIRSLSEAEIAGLMDAAEQRK
mgnify:FL=1